ncbi:hypothetical protein B484DRAFT_83557 [Ochromonadaceae sp. CCMP2298]|nr:hypothetical protein B484DRAFT_83557 [Ochromonadaceae sp. CCMP2298]
MLQGCAVDKRLRYMLCSLTLCAQRQPQQEQALGRQEDAARSERQARECREQQEQGLRAPSPHMSRSPSAKLRVVSDKGPSSGVDSDKNSDAEGAEAAEGEGEEEGEEGEEGSGSFSVEGGSFAPAAVPLQPFVQRGGPGPSLRQLEAQVGLLSRLCVETPYSFRDANKHLPGSGIQWLYSDGDQRPEEWVMTAGTAQTPR